MFESFPDLDQLRLPAQQSFMQAEVNHRRKRSSSLPKKIMGEFLKGPIPLNWLGTAAQLPGKAALATALAIMFEVGRRRSNEIKLTTAILDRFNVNRKAKYRGLKQLEAAKLISVVRAPRKNPVVTVLVVDADNHAESEKQSVTGD